MMLKILSRQELLNNHTMLVRPWHDKYLAMFSSVYGGIVTDPSIMMVPADDHLIHRGDGVFDVARCFHGGIYQFDGHLDRLMRSAAAISLEPPYSRDEIKEIAIATARVGGEENCLIRLTVSRGPGGFSVNPSECPKSELYVNVFRSTPVPKEHLVQGVRVVTSKVPIKPSYFARVKSCNYLPNVLMAMEANRAGAHYSVILDEKGCLAEGSAENIAVVSQNRELLFPEFDRILKGLTVSRAAELARDLLDTGEISDIRFADIRPEEAFRAREVLILGTSVDALPVVRFDDHIIGDGKPGPVFARLRDLIIKDMTANPDIITRVTED